MLRFALLLAPVICTSACAPVAPTPSRAEIDAQIEGERAAATTQARAEAAARRRAAAHRARLAALAAEARTRSAERAGEDDTRRVTGLGEPLWAVRSVAARDEPRQDEPLLRTITVVVTAPLPVPAQPSGPLPEAERFLTLSAQRVVEEQGCRVRVEANNNTGRHFQALTLSAAITRAQTEEPRTLTFDLLPAGGIQWREVTVPGDCNGEVTLSIRRIVRCEDSMGEMPNCAARLRSVNRPGRADRHVRLDLSL